MEISGGAACFAGVDCFFSQVIAWGFLSKPKQFLSEIELIEQFYLQLNHPRVDIELCPLVGSNLAFFLSQRGYLISELSHVSFLDFKNYRHKHLPQDEFIVQRLVPEHFQQWAQTVAIGFNFPEAQQQFLSYAQLPGVAVFAITHNGLMVAGATLAIHDDIGDLGVTSTLPAYRGKGLHKRLLFARLNYAKDLGLNLATVTTTPGSISDLNTQKAAFCTAYTRIKMTVDPLKHKR